MCSLCLSIRDPQPVVLALRCRSSVCYINEVLRSAGHINGALRCGGYMCMLARNEALREPFINEILRRAGYINEVLRRAGYLNEALRCGGYLVSTVLRGLLSWLGMFSMWNYNNLPVLPQLCYWDRCGVSTFGFVVIFTLGLPRHTFARTWPVLLK